MTIKIIIAIALQLLGSPEPIECSDTLTTTEAQASNCSAPYCTRTDAAGNTVTTLCPSFCEWRDGQHEKCGSSQCTPVDTCRWSCT